MLSATAQRAIDYYGGAETWCSAKYVEAVVSVTGLAFVLKRRPFFDHAKIVMALERPFSRLKPIGKDKDLTGVFDGNKVWLEDGDGRVLSKRDDPKKYFPYGRRLFYWDDLDMAYFANYAFWNYLTFPRLLMNEQISWKDKGAGVLEAVFPETIPTHSRIQDFKTEPSSGRLMQHNYTADVISSLAKVANRVTEHAEENGVRYASARVVTPRLNSGQVLNGPVMIDIKIHSYRLTNAL